MLTFLNKISKKNPLPGFEISHNNFQYIGTSKLSNIAKIYLRPDGSVEWINIEPAKDTKYMKFTLNKLSEVYFTGLCGTKKDPITNTPNDFKELKGIKTKSVIDTAEKLYRNLESLGDNHPAVMLLSSIISLKDKDIIDVEKDIIDAIQDKNLDLNSTGFIFENSNNVIFNDPNIYNEVIIQLDKFSEETNNNFTGNKSLDMFGNEGELSSEVWTEITTSLGNISPFQNNKVSKCNGRYGLYSSDMAPVTKIAKKQMEQEFANIFRPKNNGVLWNYHIDPNGIKYGLIIYPIGFFNKECMKTIHDLLSRNIDEDDNQESINEKEDQIKSSLFEASAKNINDILSGKIKENPNEIIEFELCSFAKSEYRPLRIDSTSTIDAKMLLAKLNEWINYSNNAMQIKRPFRFKVKDNTVEVGMKIPIVMKALNILNKKWTIGAGLNSKNSISGEYDNIIYRKVFSMRDILSIFLNNNITIINKAIRHLSRYHSKLLFDVNNRYISNNHASIYKCRKDVLYIPALIGILLEKKGIQMENAKKEQAYMMGEIIALADLLHRSWYITEKNTYNFPSKLVGGFSFHSLHSKGNTLGKWNSFCKRFQFFYNWARTCNPRNEKNKNALHYYNQIKQRFESLPKEAISLKTDEDILLFSLGYFSQ